MKLYTAPRAHSTPRHGVESSLPLCACFFTLAISFSPLPSLTLLQPSRTPFKFPKRSCFFSHPRLFHLLFLQFATLPVTPVFLLTPIYASDLSLALIFSINSSLTSAPEFAFQHLFLPLSTSLIAISPSPPFIF